MNNEIQTIIDEIAADIKLGDYPSALRRLDRHHQRLYSFNPLYVIETNFDLLYEIGNPLSISRTLEYYRNLPYVSQEVEDLLKEIDEKTRRYFRQAKDPTDIDSEIRNYLLSDNLDYVLKAIYMLKKYSLYPQYFLDEIEIALTKIFAINIAQEVIPFLQIFGITKTLKINHFGELKTVKLSDVPNFYEDKVFRQIIEKIDMFNKEITLVQIASEIARASYFANYPFGFENEDVDALSLLFIDQAKMALSFRTRDSNIVQVRELKREQTLKLAKKYHLSLYRG